MVGLTEIAIQRNLLSHAALLYDEGMPDLDTIFPDLVARVGETHLRQRLTIEVEHAGEVLGRGRTLLNIENAGWLMIALYHSLKLLRLYDWGHRNFLDVRCVTNEVLLPGLPAAFDGFICSSERSPPGHRPCHHSRDYRPAGRCAV